MKFTATEKETAMNTAKPCPVCGYSTRRESCKPLAHRDQYHAAELAWNLDREASIWILRLKSAAGVPFGYVMHHARSTEREPTYIGVAYLAGGARQVTRTFGGEPTIAAAQAAVIKEIASGGSSYTQDDPPAFPQHSRLTSAA